jgi:prepilin-type N-terminal cleavage/methylation domain-containing protein
MGKGNGFTLIELLVVIAVIALLMSLLTPALHFAKAQAKAAMCKSNLHRWAIIFHMYTRGYKGLFPNSCGVSTGCLTLTKSYIDDERLRCCPTATKTMDEGAKQPFVAWEIVTEDAVFRGSYALNDWVPSG